MFSLLYRARYLALAVIIFCAACSSSKGEASSSAASPSATSSAQQSSADEWLTKAEDAAKQLKKYGFELNLNQKMSGESAGSNSTVKLDMQGRAELGPLKLDQTNKSDIDGEKSSLRAILVPDAYYMYSDEFKEWSKLSKEETANVVRTLSSLQINLAESIEGVRGLGSALAVKPSGDEIAISYNGNGPEALTFLESVLESTLDLSSMEPSVRDTIKIDSLEVLVKLDAQHHWPLSYRIDSVLTVEYEPGKPSTLEQSLEAFYSNHNATEPVVVPEEAKNAPELDPSLEDDFEFGDLQ
ncbi:DUF6612 family protein [Cohnella faecalis]|uniref:LppX_LprAFG lipoprotein n=1 Tax=Cohnella faecalis TaxID=2315694 RepID=A0A398CRB4_9BACL|nr:DUF6612 family protein [Cohnella faecalis]RIE01971.1 hypothetical protein D3H35_14465 [Cohnella faecalis]